MEKWLYKSIRLLLLWHIIEGNRVNVWKITRINKQTEKTKIDEEDASHRWKTFGRLQTNSGMSGMT